MKYKQLLLTTLTATGFILLTPNVSQASNNGQVIATKKVSSYVVPKSSQSVPVFKNDKLNAVNSNISQTFGAKPVNGKTVKAYSTKYHIDREVTIKKSNHKLTYVHINTGFSLNYVGTQNGFKLVSASKLKLTGYVLKSQVKVVGMNTAKVNQLINYRDTQIKKTKMSTSYTPEEQAKINKLKKAAKSIGNDSEREDTYATEPKFYPNFNPGQLKSTYIKQTLGWVNFFRMLSGVTPVVTTDEWNQDAQYGAATTAAANHASTGHGISHGLAGFDKPSTISDSDWQRGIAATYDSNLSSGTISPYDVIAGYITDDYNIFDDVGPGHRLWILGNISKIGVGMADAYGDLKVMSSEADDTPVNQSPVSFPGPGLYPYSIARRGQWSISSPATNYTGTPTVTVHDNTTNSDVNVSGIKTGSGYGNFGTTVWFAPDKSNIMLNHSYTISIGGLPGVADPYTYTTKLFDLGFHGEFY